VQAGGDPEAGERLLGCEALPDLRQHRHLAGGPGDARLTLGSEGQVGNVMGRDARPWHRARALRPRAWG
jgi:hypothetical protein